MQQRWSVSKACCRSVQWMDAGRSETCEMQDGHRRLESDVQRSFIFCFLFLFILSSFPITQSRARSPSRINCRLGSGAEVDRGLRNIESFIVATSLCLSLSLRSSHIHIVPSRSPFILFSSWSIAVNNDEIVAGEILVVRVRVPKTISSSSPLMLFNSEPDIIQQVCL